MHTTYSSPAHRNLATLLGRRRKISAALQAIQGRPVQTCPGLLHFYAHALSEILDAIEAIPGWASLQADLAEA